MQLEATQARRVPTTIIMVALVLLVHSLLRTVGLFGPASSRPLILLSFLLLWPTPWVLLSREDRRLIGFGGAKDLSWWPLAVLSGMAAAAASFGLCFLLYRHTAQNPFVSIRNSFFSGQMPAAGPLMLFVIFTVPAVIFSPFGEEVFCRGVIARQITKRSGVRRGIAVSAVVFATIHLLHHGVTAGGGFIGWSGVLWWVLMAGTSVLFSVLRRAGGTIWLPVLAHSAFNLMMNALIFSTLL